MLDKSFRACFDLIADRHLHLRCYGATHPFTMACSTKSPERGNAEMGLVHDRGRVSLCQKLSNCH